MATEKRKLNKKLLIAGCILLAGNLLLFMTIWLLSKYDNVELDQVIYQLKTPAAGANTDLANSVIVRVGLFGVLLTGVEVFLYFLLSGRLQNLLKNSTRYLKYCTTELCGRFRRIALSFSIFTLSVAVLLFAFKLEVFSYIGSITDESDFIKEHYVDPTKTKITFPKEKRNVIYIFLESMESTFADPEAGGAFPDDYIPELSKLAKENIHFSNTEGIGGALSYSGTTWTAAAMVAQTSGITVKVPLSADNYGGEDEYIPGVVSLGQILQEQGYRQTLLLGSDADFAGRETYFSEHGDYNIVDINALKEDGRLPEDYQEWWGYEDQKLFRFAKEELAKLAESGEPFNFTLLTADTHFPDGYACPLCKNEYEEPYANVLACSSRQVAAFVDWIKQQPFYENTTIIISGDHLTMDPKFMENVEEYQRTVYNCIINAAATPKKEINRQFATFDMFPTTLAAMGATIEGDRLGLGTNLFSKQQTLTEQLGFEKLEEELGKKSVYYNTEFLGMRNKSKGERQR